MCGIAGVWGHNSAPEITRRALFTLQHRGQEGAGIAVANKNGILVTKGQGLIDNVFTKRAMEKLNGDAAIGQVRYGTCGGGGSLNVQPFTAITSQNQKLALAHNGNLTNTAKLREQVAKLGGAPHGTTDSELILLLIALSPENRPNLVDRIIWACDFLEGAYSLLVLSENELVAVRDFRGFRPLELGQLPNGGYVVASETCALDVCGAKWLREISPGETVSVSAQGVESKPLPLPVCRHLCIFEHVYFSRPDSVVFGKLAEHSRNRMGKTLAQEHPAKADVVVGVPDSGIPAAMGFAAESGIPFERGIIRNHYIGRTFIQPLQDDRNNGVGLKLNPVRAILNGRRVVLVDDSIVRGTTSKKLVRMVREAGAREVHLRISCPPTSHPCFYGMDTPSYSELIASHNNIEEIRNYVEADSLGYLSLRGLKTAIGGETNRWCSACFTGQYATRVDHLIELATTSGS